MADNNKWICISEKKIIESPVIDIVQRDCRSSEDGENGAEAKTHRFYLLKSRDWCNIIPVTEDGKIVMVKQYRIGISDHTLEIPGGVTDPEDKNPQASALREMSEETGYSPLPNAKCVSLGWTYPNPAMQDNKTHSFIVGPVRKTQKQHLDEAEMIEVEEVPISDIPRLITEGKITHALMLNTFFFLTMQTDEGSEALKSKLRDFTL